jgi:PAS domain S-box-containing protein
MSKESVPNQILIVGDTVPEMKHISQMINDRILSPNISMVDSKKAESQLISPRFDILVLITKSLNSNVESLITISNNKKILPVILISDNTSLAYFQNKNIKNSRNQIIDYLPKDELNSLLLFKSILYVIELNKQHIKQKTLQKSYRDLFRMNPHPMWVYDLEFLRIFQVNDAAIRKYGYTRQEYMQMTLKDIRPPQDIIKLEKAIGFVKKHKKLFSDRIYRHQKKDGSIIYVELVSNIITIDKVKYGLVMANDITESLEYIRAIENQNIKLKEITFNYSHIIRAPLANMMGILNLVKEMDLNSAESAELLEHLFTSCDLLDEKIAEVVEKSISYQLPDKTDLFPLPDGG